MQRIVRAVPVKSKESLTKLARASAEWPAQERQKFLSYFGDATEQWYFQEIEGKPYIIAIVEGTKLEQGFAKYPQLDDPFFNWFRDEVLEMSGVDLRQVPKAADAELIYEMQP